MMDIEFKFKIGQVVTTVASSTATEDHKGVHGSPILVNIIERHMVECQGGVQLYYVARGNFATDKYNPNLRNFSRELTKFHEVELMTIKEYKLAKGKEGDAFQ